MIEEPAVVMVLIVVVLRTEYIGDTGGAVTSYIICGDGGGWCCVTW